MWPSVHCKTNASETRSHYMSVRLLSPNRDPRYVMNHNSHFFRHSDNAASSLSLFSTSIAYQMATSADYPRNSTPSLLQDAQSYKDNYRSHTAQTLQWLHIRAAARQTGLIDSRRLGWVQGIRRLCQPFDHDRYVLARQMFYHVPYNTREKAYDGLCYLGVDA